MGKQIPTEQDLLEWWIWFQIMGALQEDLRDRSIVADWVAQYTVLSPTDVHQTLYDEVEEFREVFFPPESE